MKIVELRCLHADAGWRRACFLKVTTDEGIAGWSEYGEHVGTRGVTGVIEALGATILGEDPLAIEQIAALLKGRIQQADGGVNQHAAAAILNALLDIKGKALGVPVHALLGGALRDRVPVYWSHCGTYRARHSALLGTPPVRDYADLVALGQEVRARGFRGAKTSIMTWRDGVFSSFSPGFAQSPGFPALNADRDMLAMLDRQMAAFREGLGPDGDLMLDINFNFRAEGNAQIARTVAPYDLTWLEVDSYDAPALARLRQACACPIASYEALYGRQVLRPFLEAGAADVAIIDVAWNGYLEGLKMASLAESFDVNVATHNYAGGVLGDVMSVHFAAAIPNLRIGEFDVDDIAWKNTFVTEPLVVEDGALLVPQGPGWGTEVNEEAVLAHPPR
jgi:L-alanine-DL-glutamate epimerase and related enzymes of enolase superfamily